MPDALAAMSRALREAPPDQVVEAADRALRSAFAAVRVDVFLADYRISGLWSVLDPELSAGSLSGQGAAQRCFSSQQPVLDPHDGGRCRVWVPLTAWGNGWACSWSS